MLEKPTDEQLFEITIVMADLVDAATNSSPDPDEREITEFFLCFHPTGDQFSFGNAFCFIKFSVPTDPPGVTSTFLLHRKTNDYYYIFNNHFRRAMTAPYYPIIVGGTKNIIAWEEL